MSIIKTIEFKEVTEVIKTGSLDNVIKKLSLA